MTECVGQGLAIPFLPLVSHIYTLSLRVCALLRSEPVGVLMMMYIVASYSFLLACKWFPPFHWHCRYVHIHVVLISMQQQSSPRGLLHALPRRHPSPSKCATCVKGQLWTMSRPDSVDTVWSSYEKTTLVSLLYIQVMWFGQLDFAVGDDNAHLLHLCCSPSET